MKRNLGRQPLRLLTVKQVASRLGLRERTVRRWILLGKITYVKLGHWVRIPQRSMRDLVRRQTIHKIN